MDSTQNIMRKLKIIIGINGCISFLILLCCNTMVARYVHSLQDVTLNFMIALIMILSYASLSLIIFLIFVLIPFVIDVSKDQDERNSAIHGYLNMCNKINKFMSSQSLFKNIIDFSLIIGSIFCSLAVFHAWWWESQICMISFSLIAAILLIITVIECGTSILLYVRKDNTRT